MLLTWVRQLATSASECANIKAFLPEPEEGLVASYLVQLESTHKIPAILFLFNIFEFYLPAVIPTIFSFRNHS